LKNIDWIIHYVIGTEGPGGIVNAHTHGMERYDHLDFQLVLPLVQKQTCEILNTIGIEVQNGRKFEPNIYYIDIFTCGFRLLPVLETGRKVLRLILPDPQMRFPENPLCIEPYKSQTKSAFEI